MPRPRPVIRVLLAALVVLGLVGCAPGGSAVAGTPTRLPVTSAPVPPSTSAATPAWRVGAHSLPLRPDGFGQVEPTPPELVDRRLPTTNFLPPPTDGQYHATVASVPADVLARSTWQPACPVAGTDLRYLTMSFWGFDGRPHTGEMIVNTRVAGPVTSVFGRLFADRFPLEEMRVTSAAEQAGPPTGDGNDTTSFVCRPQVGHPVWSAHAFGLAIDVNPFCNPYTDGNLVVPELASAYLDRKWDRPGMVLPGDATVRAFAAIGWSWGGSWHSPRDLMHFTATGN